MKNNKNFVAKLAGVTMLATSALGAAAPVAGVVGVGGVGVVSSAQEVSNVELTGTMKLSGNETTNWAHRDTWQIDAKVKQRVKEGDKITFKAKGIQLEELNNSEIKLKDGTVIGKIVAHDQNYYEVNGKKYYYYDNGEQWNNENSALYTQDLNKLNDGHKNLKPDTQMITDFEIVFNKKAEEFNTLDFSIGLTNKRSSTILSSKDREVVYSIESGGKTIVKNSFQVKGDPTQVDQTPFNVGVVENLNEVTNTDKGLGNGGLYFIADASPSEPLKKGDRIVMESKSDSNFKFDSENNRLKVGSVLTTSHGRTESKGDSLINEHGAYIVKSNYFKAKVVESTPDKVVLEVMNDTYTETANFLLPVKITSYDGYNKEQNKISGMKYYISTETNDPRTTKSASAPTTIQVKGTTVGGSGVRIQYKTTQWVDEATKKAIKNSKIAETVEPAGTIDGYTFVRTDTDSKTGSVTHVFKKNPGKRITLEKDDVKVTTKWIDEATKESLSKVVIGDKPVEPGTIKGYTFVRTEHPTETEYVHVFKKNEEPKKVVTRFVDENGNLIKEKPGTVEKEEIPDYTYLKTEKDKDGNTTHYYKSVNTIHKDESGEVIKTDKGKKPAEKLKGYTFVKTETDKDGNTVHIYHKIVTKFVNVKDGKQFVIKTKDGDQPKEDIDGYDFEKTEKDENNGDVIHVYKTKAKVADKKEAVKTGASAGKIILPVVGLAGLGGLVSFAARKRFKKNNK